MKRMAVKKSLQFYEEESMLNIKNRTYCPTLEEIGEYVSNSAFTQFCEDVKARYHCKEKIEFSSCSWEYG